MSLLSVGREAPDGPNRKEIVDHINGAIKQLNDALDSDTPNAESSSPAAAKRKEGNVKSDDAVGSSSVEVASLERIYQILALANHDYRGHRIKAMNAIRRACRTLGGHISGDGKGKENQIASDKQLIQSLNLLQQIRDSFAASDPKSVLNDMNEAVMQLGTALSIK